METRVPYPVAVRTRLLRELPWLIGALLAATRFWWAGQAFVLDQQLGGYQWPEYMRNAWMVVHRQDVGYMSERSAGPAMLQGWLGELFVSYPNGALVFSGLCMLAALGGTALAGRALAGPWAGAAAALALTFTAAPLDATRWANHYPVQAAGFGLALGFGAACARWPRLSLALLSGLGAALAWSLDARGLAVAPVAGGLVFFGVIGTASWARRGALVVLFFVGLAAWPASRPLLWTPDGHVRSLADDHATQQGVADRWIRLTGDETVTWPCLGAEAPPLMTLASATSECGPALLRYNALERLPKQLPFGLVATLAGLGLSVLPGRRGVRASLVSGLTLFGGLASLILLAAWVPLPERYLLAWSPVLALALPVGLTRLLTTVAPPRAAAWLVPIGLSLALGAAWLVDPSLRDTQSDLDNNPHVALRLSAATAARTVLGPDDHLLDCTDLSVAVQLLPRLSTAPPPQLRLREPSRCLDWVAQPQPGDGSAFVFTQLNQGGGPREQSHTATVSAAVADQPDWSAVWEWRGATLWRWEPASE